MLRGGAGPDTLDGGAGSDTASYYTSAAGVTVNLMTGAGTGGDAQGDICPASNISTAASSTTTSPERPTPLRCGAGAVTIFCASGPVPPVTMVLDGGAGRDLLSFWDSSDEHVVNLQADSHFVSIEDIHGGQVKDVRQRQWRRQHAEGL